VVLQKDGEFCDLSILYLIIDYCFRSCHSSPMLYTCTYQFPFPSPLRTTTTSRDGWRNTLRQRHQQMRQRCLDAGAHNAVDAVTGGWCLVHKVRNCSWS